MHPLAPGCDFTELRSLVALAEHLHFGRAAQALGVSQPALTKRIQRLEAAIGGPLILRGHRAPVLTEPGRLLYEEAKTLLHEAEQALEVSRQAVRGEAGRLRIGFGIASIAQLLPEMLLRFRAAHPGVQLTMTDMSSAAQASALRDQEIDLGFLRMPIIAPDLGHLPILRESVMAAVPQRSAWNDRRGLASLADQPFVFFARSFSGHYYDRILTLCGAAGFVPRIVTETNDLFSLLQLVRAGIGVAVVPSAAATMRVPRVRLKKLTLPQASWDIALAWRKGPRDPLVEAFVKQARQLAPHRGNTASGGT